MMKNLLMAYILTFSILPVYAQSTFGDFEGTYKVTDPQDESGPYALLTLKHNGEALYRKYNTHGLVLDCVGSGKMLDGIIMTALICERDGEQIAYRFGLDISSALAFYDTKFDPDQFLAITYAETQGGSIQKKQEYLEKM